MLHARSREVVRGKKAFLLNRLLPFVSLLILSCTTEVSNGKRLLHTGWEFRHADSVIYRSADVPGSIHLDLWAQGAIGDPYWRNNESEQAWIENEHWVYRTEVSLTPEELQADVLELECDGLDTYAKLFWNGSLILEADNMFRSWRIDLSGLRKRERNTLEIHFESPVEHNKKRVAEHPYRLPSGNESEQVAHKVSSFTRKAAYQFGWDWGPRFVGCGIWRPIGLRHWNEARIDDIHTQTLQLSSEDAQLQTEVRLEVNEPAVYRISLDSLSKEVFLDRGSHSVLFHRTIDAPKLWWCNGLGAAHLYSSVIRLARADRSLDEKDHRFGIRTIELVREEDSIGTSFFFKLNGREVFAKGANYIPQDLFPSRVEDRRYMELLSAVEEAGMNMLRVWGGGVYERDLFYDLCDEKGIMVWQDFMFAGSLYPSDTSFLFTVERELEDNIRRLRRHPCLALWCGNNEIEVAWKNWGWQTQYGYSRTDSMAIWSDYLQMFDSLIPAQLAQMHPQLPYVSSSPLSNWGTRENFNHHSMHYWGVWHGKDRLEDFDMNVGRFMVEYGFQSYPEQSTLLGSMEVSDLDLSSEVMANRQKSYVGNGLIDEFISAYLGPAEDFGDFVQKSQRVQAMALQRAIRAHVEADPHCMGTLFWQLNDCWPGPSWSVIDHQGRRKQAYQAVKSEFLRADSIRP